MRIRSLLHQLLSHDEPEGGQRRRSGGHLQIEPLEARVVLSSTASALISSIADRHDDALRHQLTAIIGRFLPDRAHDVSDAECDCLTPSENGNPSVSALSASPWLRVGSLLAEMRERGRNDPHSFDCYFHCYCCCPPEEELGSISWEKRDSEGVLLGGATFTVGPVNPQTGSGGPLTVVDNGQNDADPDVGQIQVNDVKVGTYVVTEVSPPAGYAEDDDSTRNVTVSNNDLDAVIGSPLGSPPGTDDPGNTDESDFHNDLAPGSISWEKRDEQNVLQGGATFTIVNSENTFSRTVVDNGLNDIDSDPGQIKVVGIPLGNYTVTETVAPAGYALDDDPTRGVSVSAGDLDAVIGSPLGAPPGVDDPGNSNESDFHNRLGIIEWEKRDETNALQGGATFTVVNDAQTFQLTVVDNGAHDTDPDAGQISIINIPLDTYTVTETVAPAGYALDDDPTRRVTVRETDLRAEIGTPLSAPPSVDDPGNSNESDFHNRLGIIEWEKRDENNALQGGATFTVVNDAQTFQLTVVDNGANDTDPDAGQISIINIPLDTYTVTETVAPAGYALDDDPTRRVTVRETDLRAEIGTPLSAPPSVDDPGNTNESDFHNRLGSIEWEKRDENNALLGGATFTIVNTADTFSRTVVDNGANDVDPDAGQIKVLNIPLDSYVVTETVAPAGYALDDDPTRAVTVSENNLSAEIGTPLGDTPGVDDPGNSNESDFHNAPLPGTGSLAWEKRDYGGRLLGGATFTVVAVNPPAGSGTSLTVVDNGLNDADPVAGQIRVNGISFATYEITETKAPGGYVLDSDPTRVQVIDSNNVHAVVGTPGVDDSGTSDESDFHNRQRHKRDCSPRKWCVPVDPCRQDAYDRLAGSIRSRLRT